MTQLARINQTLAQAIAFIVQAQEPDGSFSSLSAATGDYHNALTYRTTFFSSNILAALNVSANSKLSSTKQRAADFLLQQKSPAWSFNYWHRQSLEFTRLPYPDDLDDTFCALGSLAAFDPKIITGQTLAHAVELLTAAETKPGGPYRTWLVAGAADPVWLDVDLAVNANIAWFLAQQKVILPNVTQFLADRVEQQNLISPYYPTIYPVAYFIARAHIGPALATLTDLILSQQNTAGNWNNPLNTALAITTLLRCGLAPSKINQAVDYLLHSVNQRGFQPHPFCLDPQQEGQKYFAGSASLTASFIVEALTLCQQALAPVASASMRSPDLAADRFYAAVVEQVTQYFNQLPKALAKQAALVLQQTLQRDTDRQIILLPYWFASSLNQFKEVEEHLLQACAAANLYGWIAYTIYDNIIDEAKQIDLLPLANVCLRQVITVFSTELDSGFDPLFQTIMDKMEAANAWESAQGKILIQGSNLTLPQALPHYRDYTVLADKSFGHILGPLAVPYSLGYEIDSPEMEQVQQLFRHCLIARQLNDDAHDWQDDLKTGQLTSVATLLLQQAQGRGIIDKAISPEQFPALQELFWQETIHQVSELILQHIKQARALAQNFSVMIDYLWLERLLDPLEHAARQATEQAGKAKDFLTTYGQTTL
jgi:hypothetical protein